MPVGEVFLSAFLQVLFDRLAPDSSSLFPREDEIRSTLKQWKKKLLMIQTVLNDAEEQQLTNKAVKMWLDDLRGLAYDVEDVLDEYATQALERQLMTGQSTNSIADYFSSLGPSALMSKLNMKSKVEEISGRLEDLCEQRDYLGLERIAGGTSTARWQRPPSTCVPTELVVFGRDDDKAKILEMVLKDEPSDHVNFRVVPIIGMGGVGKTTLAREVYNDKALKDLYPRAWICISNDFNVFRISKAILESMTCSPCNLTELNPVQIKLREQVHGKRFLLVLDDVWNTDYGLWEILKSPFMAGAPGSRIILTTRMVDAALTMGQRGEYYNLELLSEDACWDIFKNHAFHNKDFDPHQTSEFISKKVVEKCRGLPLAARTLGGLLRCKQRDSEWEDVLNSKIWNLSENSEISAVLKLSYHHLPSHLKRCFAYCAIFSKDYEFMEKDLILLWMAESLIQPSEDNRQLEDIGSEYFQDLLSRSIFQKSNNDGSKYIMHDLVNDLAHWASGDTCFRLEDGEGINKQMERYKKIRYLSYTCALYNGKHKFEIFHEVENLRTILQVLLVDDYSTFHYISNIVPLELLPKFKRLRVLSLRRYNIKKLSDSIGNLRHLRYLNLSNTHLTSLPDSINFLFNLQILIIRNCSRIKMLPPMENFIGLQHFDLQHVNLIKMPWGVRNWKYLQTLSNFIVGKDTKFGLEDLKNLKFLRDKLCISGLENVIDLQFAILGNKEKLVELVLSWRSKDEDVVQSSWRSGNEVLRKEVEKNVLDTLRPHKNLEKLTIKCYSGTQFPNWVGDSSFSNITDLKLESCKNCTSLPSLGMLVSLKKLIISLMMGLKSIGNEIYGNSSSKTFQSLETLHFENLYEWENWDPVDKNGCGERFPQLQELFLINCPKLSRRLPEQLPLLKKLEIRGCAQLQVSFSTLPMLCELKINKCKEIVCSSPAYFDSLSNMMLSNISHTEKWSWKAFQKVEYLRIVNCERLNEIYPVKPPKEQHMLTSLRELYIVNCPSLISIPEADFLCTLTKLAIRNCNSLTSLPQQIQINNKHLECLQIEGCGSLTSIVRGQLPSSLKKLWVKSCEKLLCLLDDKEVVGTSSSASSSSVMPKENLDSTSTSVLEDLFVSSCSSLICLSSKGQLPKTLKHLHIDYCYKLTTLSSTGQLPATLTNLFIASCSELMALSLEGQLPEGLEDLGISICPKLESIGERRFHNNMSLVVIDISGIESLECLPSGLYNLSRLQTICVSDCPNIVSFPAEGLPNTILQVSIKRCQKLNALPNSIHSLNSLQSLTIWECPSIVMFPAEGFPTNLTSLDIAGLNIYEPLIQWGLHRLTSLTSLEIRGCADAISFPQEEKGMKLPSSLTRLAITEFPKLKCLSSNGFQDLTSLQYLYINECPNLESFPSEDILSSVLHLSIYKCPLLKERCKRNGQGERPKIAHIPLLLMW